MTKPYGWLAAMTVVAVIAGTRCSCTVGNHFEECRTDIDCGDAAACSEGYCLALPVGCRREEAGGASPFEQSDRFPIAVLLPLNDDAMVQRLNAMRLAVAEVNEEDGIEERRFGLFVCDTAAEGGLPISSYTGWMVENLKVPVIVTSTDAHTQLAAEHPARLDAGTMIISPMATAISLISTFHTLGNVWRISPPDTFQGQAMVQLITNDFAGVSPVRLRVLAEAPDHIALASAIAQGLTALDDAGTVNSFTRGIESQRVTAINSLINDSPMATVMVASASEARELIRLARVHSNLTLDGGHHWYLTESIRDPLILNAATPDGLNLAKGLSRAQDGGPAYTSFRSNFVKNYGTAGVDSSYLAQSYDTLWVVMLATAATQSINGGLSGPNLGVAMSRLLRGGQPHVFSQSNWGPASKKLMSNDTINIEGASGTLNFGDAGAAKAPYELWQIIDAGFVPLGLR